MLSGTFFIIQFFFTVVVGLYFLSLLRGQHVNKNAVEKESKKELEKLQKLKNIKLAQPLSEKTRPVCLEEIVGQAQGLKALRAALCGPNPQHVIIYGPPGIGKTAAARVILEEAKKTAMSPFTTEAKFVEVDATSMRYDERNIADPLIGSVHDPIYQGAGAYGAAGIPQPKQGAVTKAHGGILFIDEIGELHPVQINKLLKVLEDRKVLLESAYYSSEDKNIPIHIHDIFNNGFPADFRLVGATTRSAEEIPAAIRSRCVEVYFKTLCAEDIEKISINAVEKGGFRLAENCANLISKYASNGRDAVNIVQIAGGVALMEGSKTITVKDIEWVLEFGHYNPRIDKKAVKDKQIGYINGLAVIGNCTGLVTDIEVTAMKTKKGLGNVKITGIIEEEEMDGRGHKYRKTSSAKSSLENVMTVLKRTRGLDCCDYDIHINFPGSFPVDGPSAGLAMTAAIYSAINELPIASDIAMTGEISIRGKVRPVGGVVAKVEAAKLAGMKQVFIPKENWQEIFEDIDMDICPVDDIDDVFSRIFGEAVNNITQAESSKSSSIIAADSYKTKTVFYDSSIGH